MIIQERFGNTDKIAHELTQVHKKISIQEIGWIMGLSWAISTIAISFLHALQNCSVDSAAMCSGGSLIASIAAPLVFLFPLIAIFFDQFSQIFLGVVLALYGLSYLIARVTIKVKDHDYRRHRTVGGLVSCGLIVHWAVFFLSYRPLERVVQPDQNSILEFAGFPFQAFAFPYSPLGGDYVPLSTWPNFYKNFVIWLLVGSLIYLILPQRYKQSNKFVIQLACTAGALTLYGLMRIILAFD